MLKKFAGVCSKSVRHARGRVCHAGVNFINILRTNFLYERRLGSFFLVTFLVTFLPWRKIRTKTCTFNVDEIDDRRE
jgi:hypothetical protein